MANANTAAKVEETTDEKIARILAENAALRSEKKEIDASIPKSVSMEISVGGKTCGNIVADPVEFKVKPGFKTGSRGFRGFDKVVIGGRRYQVNVQLVEIHSASK